LVNPKLTRAHGVLSQLELELEFIYFLSVDPPQEDLVRIEEEDFKLRNLPELAKRFPPFHSSAGPAWISRGHPNYRIKDQGARVQKQVDKADEKE
jgi:hypothetical protein